MTDAAGSVTILVPRDWYEGTYRRQYARLIKIIRTSLAEHHLALRVVDLVELGITSDLEAIKTHLGEYPNDGLIIPRSDLNTALEDFLRTTGTHYVLFGSPKRDMRDVSYVDTENFTAFYEVSQHVMSLGHKAIAFLNGYNDYSYSYQREQGFRAAALDRGLFLREDWFFYGKPTRGVGSLMASQALRLNNAPTAFICATDELAEGVIDTFRAMHILPGEDLSVTGYGGEPSQTSELTTLRFDIERVAVELARVIADQMLGIVDQPVQIRIPCELVIGSTSARPGYNNPIETALLQNQRALPSGFYSADGYAGLLSHFERAQRLAAAGSWRFDPAKNIFELSNEACFLLDLRPKPSFQLSEIFTQLENEDQALFSKAWEEAVTGKYFTVTTRVKAGLTQSRLQWTGDFVVNSTRELLCAEGSVKQIPD